MGSPRFGISILTSWAVAEDVVSIVTNRQEDAGEVVARLLEKILIVGGGIGGMCSAVQLAKAGLDATLVDIDPNWRVYGAGITITGPTFRALREVGVMEQVIERGFPGRGSRVRTQSGMLLKEVINVGLEPGIPDGGGILRPALHQILSDETVAMGVRVRLGLTVERVSSNPREAVVGFSDRSEEHFDLVIGADGINSKVRSLAFPDTPAPRFTGQGAWRVLAPRPPEVDMIEMYLGGTVKAGVTPVSQNQLYMFTLSRETAGEFIAPAAQPGRLREVLTGFGGLIGEIRDSLNADSPIVYRPLQIVLLPPSWLRGRRRAGAGAGNHPACGFGGCVSCLRAPSFRAMSGRCGDIGEGPIPFLILVVRNNSVRRRHAFARRSDLQPAGAPAS